MKLYQAMFKAFDDIKVVLDTAGLVDGTTLFPEEVKSTRKVLYWYLTVKSEEAAKKQIYITYDLVSTNEFHHGDGRILSYNVIIQLYIFTNKENIRSLIESINDSSELNNWKFDLATGTMYDSQLKLYIHTFNLKKVIAE